MRTRVWSLIYAHAPSSSSRLCVRESSEMLDYVTYKYVRLRDSRLGALYYILALLILVYSLIEVFLRKGYLQVHEVAYSQTVYV